MQTQSIRQCLLAAGFAAQTVQAQWEAEKQVQKLEAQKRSARQEVFAAEDRADAKRQEIIAALQARLEQHAQVETVMVMGFEVA